MLKKKIKNRMTNTVNVLFPLYLNKIFSQKFR